MKDLHHRIRISRKKKNLSQTMLSHALKVSQPTIANWESGYHIPHKSALEKLAKELDVCPSWLTFGESSHQATLSSSFKSFQNPIRNIPVYEWPQSGEEFQSSFDQITPKDFIPVATDRRRCFALQYCKKGMEPVFPKGTYIIFDRDISDLKDLSYYLFEYTGGISLYQWRAGHAQFEKVSRCEQSLPTTLTSPSDIIAQAKIIFKHL